ncbi:hypothetical protein [Pseudomonas sp.]|uniref:hypothetical protein n=1 Tax=Pseudomonas sp. TaxID=306 RepID=UPI002FC952E4
MTTQTRIKTGREQWQRTYTLTVNRKGTQQPVLELFGGLYRKPQDSVLGEQNSLDMGLNISFDISKSANIKDKGANSASIEVFNLNREQIALLNAGKNLHCTLAVSYGEATPNNLYSGDVKSVNTRKSGTEFITQILMGDGYTELTETKLKGMIPPGTTVEQALDQLVKSIPNLSRGSIVGTNLQNPIVSGWRISGKAKDVLKKFCEEHRIEYTIDSGVFTATSPNMPSTDNQVMATVISVSTGMIDSPFEASEDPDKGRKDPRRRRRVQVSALINSEVVPASLIYIEDTFITGLFRVNDIRYSGEYRGDSWLMEIQASEVSATDLDQVAASKKASNPASQTA